MSDACGKATVPLSNFPLEITHQRVVDEKTAAEFIGVAPITLERMRKTGVGPCHVQLSSRRIGYRVCHLVHWLDARTSKAPTEA